MFKKIAQSSAIALALTVFAAAPSHVYAQQVVTGGNPMPSGENAVMTPEQSALLIGLVAVNTI